MDYDCGCPCGISDREYKRVEEIQNKLEKLENKFEKLEKLSKEQVVKINNQKEKIAFLAFIQRNILATKYLFENESRFYISQCTAWGKKYDKCLTYGDKRWNPSGTGTSNAATSNNKFNYLKKKYSKFTTPNSLLQEAKMILRFTTFNYGVTATNKHWEMQQRKNLLNYINAIDSKLITRELLQQNPFTKEIINDPKTFEKSLEINSYNNYQKFERFFKTKNNLKNYTELYNELKKMMCNKLNHEEKELLLEWWNYLESIKPNAKPITQELVEFRNKTIQIINAIIEDIEGKIPSSKLKNQIVKTLKKNFQNQKTRFKEQEKEIWIGKILKNEETILNKSTWEKYSSLFSKINTSSWWVKKLYQLFSSKIEECFAHKDGPGYGHRARHYFDLVREIKIENLHSKWEQDLDGWLIKINLFNLKSFTKIIEKISTEIINDFKKDCGIKNDKFEDDALNSQ